MSTESTTRKSRSQTILLGAIAALLAVDVGSRLMERSEAPEPELEPAVMPVSFFQPERDPVDILANPLSQRRMMIDQLKSIDRRLMAIEGRFDSNLRVEVTNFPKVQPETD